MESPKVNRERQLGVLLLILMPSVLAVVTRTSTHIVTALVVASAARLWLRGASPRSSFSSPSFTFTAQTRLICLVNRVVYRAHISMCSATTSRSIDPSASASIILRTVVAIAGHSSVHVWLIEDVSRMIRCLDNGDTELAVEA